MLGLASRLLQGGQVGQAEQMYRQILAREPSNPEATHFLGMCLLQTGRRDDGLAALRRSVGLAPSNESFWRNLGIVLLQLNELTEAETSLRRAVSAKADSAPAHNYLAVVLVRTGRFDEALKAFERALVLSPDDDSVHNSFGYALLEHSEVEPARERFRRAIELNPRNAMAHNNLGNALRALGDVPGSLASYRRAVEIEPGSSMARFNLARALVDAGQPDAALEHLHAVARLAPQEAAIWQWLADVLAQFRFNVYKTEIEFELVECFSRPDIEPAYLASATASLLRADPRFRDVLLLGGDGAGVLQFNEAALRQLARPLLLLMLENVVIPEPDFEDMIGRVRRAAILAWQAGSLTSKALLRDILSAIAHHCFRAGYAHEERDDELRIVDALARRLENALAGAEPPRDAELALLACYRPLCELPGAEGLPASDASVFGRLVLRQVREPMEEAQIAAALPSFTPISDEVSRAVQVHYEEHPYPSWIRLPSTGGAFPLALRLRTLFPHAEAASRVPDQPSILIAGCGTGRHTAITSAMNPNARILAVDLSRASLAYAARRAKEIGLRNIEFAQADILELGGLERRFDVIECSGVLHHMKDPLAGWRVLVRLLAPGGKMKVGLYSEIARRGVVNARRLIAERGFAADAAGMRAARATILALPIGDPARSVMNSLDFFSLSGCRDLLFHVQERRYSLGEIDSILGDLGLEFLGFEFATEATRAEYKREFPADPVATSLANWAEFEARHPDTFVGMYHFWVASRP